MNDIRTFLNISNALTESVGLANRKQGDEFINNEGHIIIFDNVAFYPEGGGQFADQEELLDAITAVEDEEGVQIEWFNKSNASSLAFGVAKFTDAKKTYLFGRYYTKVFEFFTSNSFPNILPNGYHLNKASSNKMRSGLMVQDILTSFEDLTARDIIDQIAEKFGSDHPLTSAAYAVAKGQQLPIYINKGDIDFTGFRDYFGEILQPLALMSGNEDNYTGTAKEAEKIFFKKNGFTTCTVTFSTGKNTGLYDSLITNKDGKVIKLSSKGGVGASASVKNLLEAINELKTSNKLLYKKYSDVVEICEIVNSAGQHGAPIELARKFQIISAADAKAIYKLRTDSSTPLSATLKKMLSTRLANADDAEKSVPYYALLASIAKEVENHVNVYTNFGEQAADILNNSALVQVYTKASESGDTIIVDKFRTVYPSTMVDEVLFYSGKGYYSTGVKGNFTFKISKSAPEPAEVETKPETKKPLKLNTRVDVRPGKDNDVTNAPAPRTRR